MRDHPQAASAAEAALDDLLAGPFDKVSMTIPAALRARVARRSTDTNFSAYVSEVLAREERRLALVEFLDGMDELHGQPTRSQMDEADRRWEELWRDSTSPGASS